MSTRFSSFLSLSIRKINIKLTHVKWHFEVLNTVFEEKKFYMSKVWKTALELPNLSTWKFWTVLKNLKGTVSRDFLFGIFFFQSWNWNITTGVCQISWHRALPKTPSYGPRGSRSSWLTGDWIGSRIRWWSRIEKRKRDKQQLT